MLLISDKGTLYAVLSGATALALSIVAEEESRAHQQSVEASTEGTVITDNIVDSEDSEHEESESYVVDASDTEGSWSTIVDEEDSVHDH